MILHCLYTRVHSRHCSWNIRPRLKKNNNNANYQIDFKVYFMLFYVAFILCFRMILSALTAQINSHPSSVFNFHFLTNNNKINNNNNNNNNNNSNIYSVSQKIQPEDLWQFLQNGWEFFNQILHAYHAYLR